VADLWEIFGLASCVSSAKDVSFRWVEQFGTGWDLGRVYLCWRLLREHLVETYRYSRFRASRRRRLLVMLGFLGFLPRQWQAELLRELRWAQIAIRMQRRMKGGDGLLRRALACGDLIGVIFCLIEQLQPRGGTKISSLSGSAPREWTGGTRKPTEIDAAARLGHWNGAAGMPSVLASGGEKV
jgi:hypothetical protein